MGQPNDDQLRDLAAAKIFAKRDAILREQRTVREEQEALSARERELDREMAECRAAARFFDLGDFEPPTDERQITELRGQLEYYRRRIDLARNANDTPRLEAYMVRYEIIVAKLRAMEAQQAMDLARGISSGESVDPKGASLPTPSGRTMPRVRDIVLDQLRDAGDVGLKASPIRSYIEATYSTKLHDKTVGMTLYRLSHEGAVYRKGQTWFFGPPPDSPPGVARSENPGGDTPGQTHDAA